MEKAEDETEEANGEVEKANREMEQSGRNLREGASERERERGRERDKERGSGRGRGREGEASAAVAHTIRCRSHRSFVCVVQQPTAADADDCTRAAAPGGREASAAASWIE
jgi:hypothetical protein